MGTSLRKLATAVGLAMTAPFTLAGSGAPILASQDMWLSVNSSGDLITPSDINNGSNDFSFEGGATTAGQYAVQWDLVANPDPFIDGSITITNLSNSAQNFTVNLMLPVTPAFSPGVMGGSITATVYDFNGGTGSQNGSATLQPQGSTSNPIYFGRIDNSSVLLMFAQVVSCGGIGCSGNSSESQMPATIAVPGGVSSSIGTQLKFNLSANDKVTFSTHFEVLPVPLPASAWLMGSALLGMVGARRRK